MVLSLLKNVSAWWVSNSKWKLGYAGYLSLIQLQNNVSPWMLSELNEAFQVLLSQDQIPLRLCLFIDGLDEYEGDENEIADLFGEIAVTHGKMLCL